MTTNAQLRAQAWHEADHGASEVSAYSDCYCCCDACNPDWNRHGRTNPFWEDAMKAMRLGVPDERVGEA